MTFVRVEILAHVDAATRQSIKHCLSANGIVHHAGPDTTTVEVFRAWRMKELLWQLTDWEHRGWLRYAEVDSLQSI